MKAFVADRADPQRLLREAAQKAGKDTFLSHSSKDNDIVAGAVLILSNHGARVYVDVGDERLPEKASTETAQILRDAVRAVSRFVLLVSPNSHGSSWIPWELGLADGQKGAHAVALFPAVEYVHETAWTEREYLGLYARIVWGPLQGYDESVWMVFNYQANTATELSRWLRGY